MKTAIIGCGKIADSHASIITTIPNCTIVGVCDSEELMAKQMQERYGVRHCFTDQIRLLKETHPDVVHITTPPSSHFAIAKICLEAGSHIYVEKPFTLSAKEAEELLFLAERKGCKVTVGTNIQYSLVALRVRELVKKGYLGGNPVHMESLFCYELSDGFARAFLGDKKHWVRALPGKLFHNLISHGIARIAEYMDGDDASVTATAFTSDAIRQLGGEDIPDELRVIITDRKGTTAYFTFTTQIGPSLHRFMLYGPKRSLFTDDDHQFVTKIVEKGYKSYLNYFMPPLAAIRQDLMNSLQNLKDFAGRRLNMDAGKRDLVLAFYRSITECSPPPIPYREILLTARIMDSIFSQVNRERSPDRIDKGKGD